MKNSSYKSLLLFILIFLSSAAFAGDATGIWHSTSGSTVNLWSNMQQVVVTLTTPQGQVFKMYGWWTNFSNAFAYKAGNTTQYCTFVDQKTIRIQGTDGRTTFWTRAATNSPTTNQSNSGYSNFQQNSQGTSLDPAAWNNNIKRNQSNNTPGYNTQQQAPAMDVESWNNNLERNRNNNSSAGWE